ncbi:hypothetical protein FZC35_00555 [Candidatus Cytomitobacter indipagum]|uniref:Uncharacterized protein n=2 Tax=Candidatus Cytomitobacter indipagum TaxID=2601575 RepID=A0A5C0UCX6_9PROT|nr:hypothetical protein FZC35_00555 [Candidatus Cytomitobacter indipagum]
MTQKYYNAIPYHLSYFIIYSAFLHLQYNKYKKLMPDILCISDNFLKNWPEIIGYRIIGELKLEKEELKAAKKSIKQSNPSAILWSSKSGSEFREILEFSLKNNICVNVLRNDEVLMPSIENCLTDLNSIHNIENQKFIIYGSNDTFLKKLFDRLSENNEVHILLNKNTPTLKKISYKKIFNKKIIYDIEELIKKDQYHVINFDGITSLKTRNKNVDFLHQTEYLSKLCKEYKAKFLLITTQIYPNIAETVRQIGVAAENISQNYKGKFLRIPYIAMDVDCDIYGGRFKKDLMKNINISNNGSWISVDSAINKIIDNIDQDQCMNIHGSFLNKKEIYDSLNMLQRSWNIWPKKLDYIRGYKNAIII